MPIERKDRVRDTSTTTGTGSLTLAGTPFTGFRTFASAHTNGASVRYAIQGTGSEWEVGEGVWTSSGSVLSRVTVFASSNAGALVNLSAGTKEVISTPTAKDFNLSQTYQLTTTATTADQVIATISATIIRAVEFYITAVDATGAKYNVAKVLAIHNGTTVDSTEYGRVNINGTCGTFTADYSASTIRLLVTPSTTNSTVFKVTTIELEV